MHEYDCKKDKDIDDTILKREDNTATALKLLNKIADHIRWIDSLGELGVEFHHVQRVILEHFEVPYIDNGDNVIEAIIMGKGVR